MDDYLWWRDGVIYQIYPRSFADCNGDGLGDLPGIISRLDYLADLGIDAIWLSPIYPSPGCRFRLRHQRLLQHRPALRHPGRLRPAGGGGAPARHPRDPGHGDEPHLRPARLVPGIPLQPGQPETGLVHLAGIDPNNWQASFGGKAWEYDPATGQYYLHLFTKEQPDVNWRNPAVRKAQLDAFRFWLERGVDGFRLDVFNAYFKHAGLPDNPPKFGLRGFDRQRHLYDIDQPEMLPLLNELRALLDSYPERYAVGETYLATPQKTVSLLRARTSCTPPSASISPPMSCSTPGTRRWIRQQVARREQTFNAAGVWPTTVMSNHDLPRAASRYCPGRRRRPGHASPWPCC